MPILYGADALEGGLAETVFHNVPIRGEHRAVTRSSLLAKVISVVAPRRDLKLVQLHGFGLRRLELSRTDLLESDLSQHERTSSWARALHDWSEEVQGLVWVSRQHDTSLALVLFGDRVQRKDLEVVKAPLPLAKGVGLKKVRWAAELAGITILE